MREDEIKFHVTQVLEHLNEHEPRFEIIEHLRELHKLEPSFLLDKTFPYYHFEDVVNEMKLIDALASTEMKMKKQFLDYVAREKGLFRQLLQNLLAFFSPEGLSTQEIQ